MIRQLCTHCFATVELPPEAAGHEAPCPKCGKAISVPAAYAPSVAASGGLQNLGAPPPNTNSPTPTPPGTNPMSEPIAPPPGLNPITAAPPLAPLPTAPADSTGCSCSVAISPIWLDWIPVACFTLILGLSLFNWVGTYPGGTRVYSQTPWHALVGDISTNTLPEDLLLDEKYFTDAVTGNRWLLAYFPLLLIALALGWLDRIVRNPTVTNMPGPLAWLPAIWPRRFLVLTAISALLLIVLLIQCWRGFGLETAVKQKVNEVYAKQLEDADSTPKKQKVSVMMGQELSKYQLQGTTPYNLAIAAHAVAFAAMLGRWWLHNRGSKPHPRVSIQY